jgi:hypothetical protein
MTSKSGLPPYDAGIYFILQVRNGKLWPPRRMETVRQWKTTQMLAFMYGKTNTEVAAEIIDTALRLEEGEYGYQQRKQRHRIIDDAA